MKNIVFKIVLSRKCSIVSTDANMKINNILHITGKNQISNTPILLRKNNISKLKFAIIDRFVVCERIHKQLFIHVYELEGEHWDFIIVNGTVVEIPNTTIGRIKFNGSTQVSQIIEKVSFLHQNG